MTRPFSMVKWGTGYENIVYLRRWVTEMLTDRPAREGSEFLALPNGGRTAWIVGRDYQISMSWKFVPDEGSDPTPWSGPAGVMAFVNWMGDGNACRFVPDQTYPDAYVDGCYLVGQADGNGNLDELIRRTEPITLSHPTVDFGLMMRGLLFEYLPGTSLTDPALYTFARADATTCAPYWDAGGRIQVAAANVLRDAHYRSGVRHTLLEGLRKNKLTVASDGVTGWTAQGTPTVVAGAVVFGGLSLVHVTDDDATNAEYHHVTYGANALFTGNGAKAVAVLLWPPDAGAADGHRIEINDNTAAASRLVAIVTWTGHALNDPTMNAGAFLGKEIVGYIHGAPVWALYLQTGSVTAANTHQLYILPAHTANQVGDMYYGGLSIEDALFPSTPRIQTTSAAVQREADVLTCTWAHAPQDMTVLVELARPLHADLSGSLDDVPGILQIASGTGSLELFFALASRQISVQFNSGTSVSASQNVPAGAALAIAAQLSGPNAMADDTTGKVRLDVGSGFGSYSSLASRSLATWGANTLRVGHVAGGTDRALYGAIKRIRIAYGLRTLAAVQAQ